jgi:hypothetical protein
MTWGVESEVTERFTSAGAQPENVSFERDTYRFDFPGPSVELVSIFRDYYGPTMNAFDAAEANGKSAELEEELVTLFEAQNDSPDPSTSSIPATFLRVTVAL